MMQIEAASFCLVPHLANENSGKVMNKYMNYGEFTRRDRECECEHVHTRLYLQGDTVS
jgi:hypothetical protein